MYTIKELQNFCMNVKLLRERYNLTRREMAEILGIGIKRLELIESGIIPKKFSCSVLCKLCIHFGVMPKDLFDGKIC